MIITLTLPKPSDILIDAVRTAANNRPINYQSQQWHKNLQPSHKNCAAGDFFEDQLVNDLVASEYQKYFTEPITPLVGVIHNTESTPASYPPHSDRVRIVGVNYYIDLGGDNVETVFYNKVDPEDDNIGGHVLSYDNLPEVHSIEHFTSGPWYALAARRYHSVENILTSRCLLTLCVKSPTFEKFLINYRHMLAEDTGFEPVITISKTVALGQTKLIPNKLL